MRHDQRLPAANLSAKAVMKFFVLLSIATSCAAEPARLERPLRFVLDMRDGSGIEASEDGLIAFRGGKRCSFMLEASDERLSKIFSPAFVQEFLSTKENYLPDPDVFAYDAGHSYAEELKLLDASQHVIHHTVYVFTWNDRAHDPPPVISSLQQEILNLAEKVQVASKGNCSYVPLHFVD